MKTILKIIVAISLLTGCGNNQTSQSPEKAGAETRLITDSLGRQVQVPAAVQRILPLGNTTRMITYLGLASRIVGISGLAPDKVSPLTAYAYANKELWKNLPLVGTDAYGATSYYPEEIISVQPEVILCSYSRELADEISVKTGAPVVAVPMGTLFGRDYEEALRLLADVCGEKKRAEDVIAYINHCLEDLKNRTAKIPEADKPGALAAAATFKGSHGIEGVYSKYAIFEALGANDVTRGMSDYSGGLLVDKEKILAWNPEFIFLDSGGVQLVRIDYKENPDFYTHLSAINKRNIFQYPSSTSYYSNVEIPLVNSYYVGSILFPNAFKDINFSDKASEIFEFFLGDRNYLEKLEAAGMGYQKVNLEVD